MPLTSGSAHSQRDSLRALPRRAGLLGLACLLSTLAACADLAPVTQPPLVLEETAANPAPGTPQAAQPGASPASQNLPAVDLSGELLFRLMIAEIAVQRGEPGTAYNELMRVARLTSDPRIARRATEVAIGARALPQALEAAELWNRTAPSDPEAGQSYSSLLVANGRYAAARPLLERQIAEAPNALEILDRLQRVLARAPEPAQGYALLEALAQPYTGAPDSAFEAHLIVARGAHAVGRRADAVSHARAALLLRPDSEAAVIAVAQLLSDGGTRSGTDNVEALNILSGFVRSHPASPDARLLYARVLVGEGRLGEARSQFEDLLRQSPQNPDPLFALGVLALESESYGQARGYFERYLAAVVPAGDRDLDLVYLNMARVAEGERHFEESLDWLRKVQGADQREVALERQAAVLGRLNRVDEAMALLEPAASSSAQERVQRTLAQGQLLRDAHRYQASFDLLEKSLQSVPEDTGLLYEAAMSAERLDRVDVMEEHLRHLLRLRPDYAHAYNALGYSLADRNIRLQEAYQLIDHALRLAPDDGFIVDSMGWVQFRMGNLVAARETLTRAFQLKADPDVAAHLGEVLWASGDHSGARELLLNARKRDGDSETLRETLRRLQIQP